MSDTQQSVLESPPQASPEAPSLADTAPMLDGMEPEIVVQDDSWLGLVQQQVDSLMDLGGPVVLILAALSVVAASIILVKWWQFLVLGIERRGATTKSLQQWRDGDRQAAADALKDSRQPVARVMHAAMSGLSRPSADIALVREEVTRVASLQIEALRSYLRPLEVISTLSPLLGLLGTVMGMIVAFQQMEAAGSQVDPSILSGGIWQALLTTAVGLSVAIPTVMAHNWLERKVERCAHRMEDMVTQVFTSELAVADTQTVDTAVVEPMGYAA